MAKYYKKSNRERFYKERLEQQQGCCALCESAERLVIDHDHTTGRMRGLLCQKHNTALGLFEDNIELLERAQVYLRNNVRPSKAVTDSKMAEERVVALIVELLADASFSSDRARARELAKQTGMLEATAHTKLRRVRIKLESKRLTSL